MRVAVIQLSPGSDKDRNIAEVRGLVEGLVAEQKVDLIVLPEMWTCLGGTRAQKFAAAEVLPKPGETGGTAYEFLRELAMSFNIHVHGGSMGERRGETLFNTTLVFSPGGEEIARYSKIHLFDITTPDGQGYRESAIYGAGEEVVTFTIGETRIGLAICYDIRFPELFLALRRAGAALILLPAAFTLQTGKDHWEVLIRARAIETQCWLAACGTYGAHKEGNGETRLTYGHSLIADPWGHVVAKASDGPGWAVAAIDHRLTARVRADMPVFEHRKLA
jgi:nitrilase